MSTALRCFLVVIMFGVTGSVTGQEATTQSGWPGGLVDTFGVTDLGGEPGAEVIGFSPAGFPFVAYEVGGQEWGAWDYDFAGGLFAGGYQNLLHFGDVTGDGSSDMIHLNDNESTYLWGFDSTGILLPGFPVLVGPFAPLGPLALADVAGDDALEIVVTDLQNGAAGQIWVFDGSGNVVPGWPQPTVGLLTCLAVGDIEFDGDLEIVVGTGHYSDPFEPGWSHIYIFEHDGTLRTTFPSVGPGAFYNVALADMDGDFRCEIICGGAGTVPGGGTIQIFRDTGEIMVGPIYGPSFGFRPAIGNLDDDDDLELVIPASGLHVWDLDDMLLAEMPYGGAFQSFNSVVLADFDGDGACDIAARSNAPKAVHVWDADLTPHAGWPKLLEPGTYTGSRPQLVARDMDEDGDLELTFVNDVQIEMWDFPQPSSAIEWGEWNHNEHRTNNYHFGKTFGPRFLRGDASVDGGVGFEDVFASLGYLFGGTPQSCPARVDFNGDTSVDLADVVGLLSYSFLMGDPPAPPFPECRMVLDEPLECALEACP